MVPLQFKMSWFMDLLLRRTINQLTIIIEAEPRKTIKRKTAEEQNIYASKAVQRYIHLLIVFGRIPWLMYWTETTIGFQLF